MSPLLASQMTATTVDHEFTAEHIRLIGFALHSVFAVSQSTSAEHPDQVGQAALRVTGMAAKRLHDMLKSRATVSGMDGLTWHPAATGELAGILQVQEHTFGAALLPQLLDAAVQVLVATNGDAIAAKARKGVATWADDYTSDQVKADGVAVEVKRLTDDKRAAIALLAEVLECCW